MEDSKTRLYTIVEFDDLVVKETLKDVIFSLEERGYNPINQVVGYLMSGDLGYISSYKDSRNKIARLDRNKIIEVLIRDYLKD